MNGRGRGVGERSPIANLQARGETSAQGTAGPLDLVLCAMGVGYALFDFVGSSVVASPPGAPSADDSDVAWFLTRHEATIGSMAWLIGLSAGLLAVFTVRLRRQLEGSVLADSAAASGLMAAVIIALSSGVLLSSVGGRTSEQAALLRDLVNASVVATLPAAAMVLSVSVAVRHMPSRPAWVWRTGFPLAVLCLIPYIGWVNLKLFPIWIAGRSISLVRKRRWQPMG